MREETNTMPRITITIGSRKPTDGGYMLVREDTREPVQEGYMYPTVEEACDAMRQLWPANSASRGRPRYSGHAWSILI